ncbi:frizzled-related protein 2 [Aplysia californica]|nr:frizzled-related protein 2 [Aplysia californica]AAT07665.1 frizzled-related protein 2 [Aplysia californica]
MSGRIQQPKCVDIPSNLTLCQGIGYETMRLPNLLDHDSLKEVTQQAGSWVPLTRIACHPDTKVFLCSLFSPVCLDSLDRLIYPCRSLCQNVRASCESRMTIHGFEWPAMLECEKFPLDNDMCIMPIHDIKPDNNCTACKHPQTHEALIDHFCRSDVAMRVTLKDRRVLGTDLELVLRKRRKLYKFENMEKKEAKNLPVVIAGGTACTCETINDTQGKYLLMGNKRNGKIVINFGMAWKRKDKEFRKGLRAIRKGDC